MALIKCPECSKKVSDKAPACPSCGVVINVSNTEKLVSVIWTLLHLTVSLLLMWVGWYIVTQIEASDSRVMQVFEVMGLLAAFVGILLGVFRDHSVVSKIKPRLVLLGVSSET